MSRYIDADALMQKLDIKADCKECNSVDHYFGCLKSLDFVNACEAINEAPSIDIVFCKECKHNPWDFDRLDYTCVWDDDFAGRPQTPDDFCSYGEREGE